MAEISDLPSAVTSRVERAFTHQPWRGSGWLAPPRYHLTMERPVVLTMERPVIVRSIAARLFGIAKARQGAGLRSKVWRLTAVLFRHLPAVPLVRVAGSVSVVRVFETASGVI